VRKHTHVYVIIFTVIKKLISKLKWYKTKNFAVSIFLGNLEETWQILESLTSVAQFICLFNLDNIIINISAFVKKSRERSINKPINRNGCKTLQSNQNQTLTCGNDFKPIVFRDGWSKPIFRSFHGTKFSSSESGSDQEYSNVFRLVWKQ